MDQVQGAGDAVEDPTQKFFRDIEQSGALPEGVRPEQAASAALCMLTRRVTGGEARELADSMPSTLRSLLHRCVDKRAEQPMKFDRGQFLSLVADLLGTDVDQAERVSRAVFAAAKKHLPQREVDDVESQLPGDLAELWRNP